MADDGEIGEVVCTAQRDAQGDLPNPLFTPPCECPNCAVEPAVVVDDAAETMWIAVSGHPVRFEVDRLQLGAESSTLL